MTDIVSSVLKFTEEVFEKIYIAFIVFDQELENVLGIYTSL